MAAEISDFCTVSSVAKGLGKVKAENNDTQLSLLFIEAAEVCKRRGKPLRVQTSNGHT